MGTKIYFKKTLKIDLFNKCWFYIKLINSCTWIALKEADKLFMLNKDSCLQHHKYLLQSQCGQMLSLSTFQWSGGGGLLVFAKTKLTQAVSKFCTLFATSLCSIVPCTASQTETCTVREVGAEFTVFDWWRYCNHPTVVYPCWTNSTTQIYPNWTNRTTLINPNSTKRTTLIYTYGTNRTTLIYPCWTNNLQLQERDWA